MTKVIDSFMSLSRIKKICTLDWMMFSDILTTMTRK